MHVHLPFSRVWAIADLSQGLLADSNNLLPGTKTGGLTLVGWSVVAWLVGAAALPSSRSPVFQCLWNLR